MTHAGIVYWSNEDDCYVGLCPSLFHGGVHGRSEKRVRAELDKVIRMVEKMDAGAGRKKRTATRRSVATRVRGNLRRRTRLRKRRR
jgi:hypothetical protein